MSNFGTVCYHGFQLLMVQPIFTARFSFSQNVLDLGAAAHIKLGDDIGQSLASPKHLLDFIYVALFWNKDDLSRLLSKILAKFRILYQLLKLGRGG